ncbi:hypothetical protein G3I40_00415 [Streptomyces sp. SID14478]|uniref:hypothetical protein n=1 Tax=Streptomyces sp. SID14478 TaxID=2706073 RepID=UPI0013DA0E32|nr:hypothetical protein [Streptomyces sp. SID14478]NEB73717.1 hypothetical protein [Streptomyces sp. SID14478]
MSQPDEQSWSEALGMYARKYTIAKVVSRDHEDWALDVLSLMHSGTPDARGWYANDPLAGEFERVDDPYYPFALLPKDAAAADHLRGRVNEIPRSSVVRLLVAVSTPWINVEKEQDFELRREGLEEKARVILSRFPEGSCFYANTGRRSKEMDYYQRISGCATISRHAWDVGLFLVSATEVGMVWSFINW